MFIPIWFLIVCDTTWHSYLMLKTRRGCCQFSDGDVAPEVPTIHSFQHKTSWWWYKLPIHMERWRGRTHDFVANAVPAVSVPTSVFGYCGGRTHDVVANAVPAVSVPASVFGYCRFYQCCVIKRRRRSNASWRWWSVCFMGRGWNQW